MSTTHQNKKHSGQEDLSLPAVINTSIHSTTKRVVRTIVAFFLIVIGIIGMILPFLHGFSFLLGGLIILSFDFPSVDERLKRYVSKHKGVEKLYNALYKRLYNKFNK